MEIYNEWLIVNHLDEYVLYQNDDDGIELCMERNFYVLPTTDIIDILVQTTHYDIYDRLVTFDYTDGFRSLDDEDIKERFENQDFLDYLDGVKESDYDVD